MTNQQIRTLEIIQGRVQSLLDGKSHAHGGGCGAPIGRNIYVESWVLPQLQALLDHAKGEEDELQEWVYKA